MGNEPVQTDGTTQPGVQISSQLWQRFRDDVRDRKGRINGALASELENAISNYLKASHGYDVEHQLDELADDVDSILDAIDDGGAPTPSSESDEKIKKSRRKDSPREQLPEADGGVPVDDRHLYDDVESDDELSAVERRTEAAVAELVTSHTSPPGEYGGQFILDDLDDAIETGADVHSTPTLRKYRERVLDRLGGIDELTIPARQGEPIESRVFYTDVDDARAARASNDVVGDGVTVEQAASSYDIEPERVRWAMTNAQHGAILVRDDDVELDDAAERSGASVESIVEILPDEFVDSIESDDASESDELDELANAKRVESDVDDTIESSIESSDEYEPALD